MSLFSKLFNRKKKQKYKASDFSRSRIINNQTQHYHDDTNQWVFLYLILDSFDDCDGDLDQLEVSHSQPEDYSLPGRSELNDMAGISSHDTCSEPSSTSYSPAADSYSSGSSYSSSDSGSGYSSSSDSGSSWGGSSSSSDSGSSGGSFD